MTFLMKYRGSYWEQMKFIFEEVWQAGGDTMQISEAEGVDFNGAALSLRLGGGSPSLINHADPLIRSVRFLSLL